MKLGIVGTGTIVEEVLPVLQQVKGLSCYGICGTKRSEAKAEKLKEQYQMQLAVSDYEKLLDSEIDTVYIAAPNLLHFEMAKEAVLRGKHVIVEKPMTANERQAEELCALAKKQGVFLFEAITTRYQPNYQFIKEQLPTIGKIKMAVCNFSQYSRKYDRFRKGETIPVFDVKQAGGAMMDLNLYNIQYLEGLFGEPQSVHYTANMEKGIDTSGVAVLSYPGFQAVAIGAKDCQGQPEYRIEGSEGYIAQNSPCNVCGAVTIHYRDGREVSYDGNGDAHRMHAEFVSFVKEIASKDTAACYEMLDHSIAVSRILTRAREDAGIVFPCDEEN